MVSQNFFFIKLASSKKIQQHWQDILIFLSLSIIGGIAAYQGAKTIDPAIYDWKAADVWFGSDVPRAFYSMTTTVINRAQVHPLYALLVYPLTTLLSKGFDISEIHSVRLVLALIASLWLSTFFTLLRLIGCHRIDAILFSIVGATSAASMFWFVVPETYALGSLSILLALCFVTLTQYYCFSSIWYIAVTILTLGVTLTNGLVGMLAIASNHAWKRSLQIIVNSIFGLIVIWELQKFVFTPDPASLINEKDWISFPAGIADFLKTIEAFVSYSMVMPTIRFDERTWLDVSERLNWPYLTTSIHAPDLISTMTTWGKLAVGVWTALLALGVWGFFTTKSNKKLRIVLLLVLLAQMLLHSVYGRYEIFIYSLHFLPLLIIVAVFSTVTRARLIGLGLASLLIICNGFNNGWQLMQAKDFVSRHGPPREQAHSQRVISTANQEMFQILASHNTFH